MIDGAKVQAPAVHPATNSRPGTPAARSSGSGNKRLRKILFALIGLLYVMSVPWYRASDSPLNIRFGLPDWVAVAIACYIGVAILNAIAWMLTEIPDQLETTEDPDDATGGAP